eukprot:gene22060-biopygen16225
MFQPRCLVGAGFRAAARRRGGPEKCADTASAAGVARGRASMCAAADL